MNTIATPRSDLMSGTTSQTPLAKKTDVPPVSAMMLQQPVQEQEQRAPAVEPEQLQQAADQINSVVGKPPLSLHFKVDSDTGKPIVTVVDKVTDEVIRQIPAEEVVNIAKHLDEMSGLLLKAEA